MTECSTIRKRVLGSWTTLKADGIKAMEMWTRRKTTRIKGIKPKSIKYDVKIDHQNDRGIRRIRFIGHIMRHDNLVLDTMEGKINEKRKRDTTPGNSKKKMSWPSYETTERLTEKKICCSDKTKENAFHMVRVSFTEKPGSIEINSETHVINVYLHSYENKKCSVFYGMNSTVIIRGLLY